MVLFMATILGDVQYTQVMGHLPTPVENLHVFQKTAQGTPEEGRQQMATRLLHRVIGVQEPGISGIWGWCLFWTKKRGDFTMGHGFINKLLMVIALLLVM